MGYPSPSAHVSPHRWVARVASPDDLPALRRIYETCFPPEERMAWPEQAARIADGSDSALVACNDEGAVTGFALLTDLTSKLSLLAYLAVDGTARSSGVGAALLAAARDHVHRSSRSWLLIEVEPADSAADDDFGDPLRRIRFYTRLGATRVATGYAMPNPIPEGSPLVDLDLYALAVNGPAPPPELNEVRDWVDHLWGPACYNMAADDVLRGVVMSRLRLPRADLVVH
jgi:GNAT superfamily N-acetyltransferase